MKVLKPLVNELVNLVKKGVNLAKDELPLIAKQILAFYFWASVIWLTAGALLMLTGLYCHIQAIPVVHEGMRHGFRDDDPSAMWIVGAVVAYALGAVFIVANAIDIVKIKVAPRLFLLEYLKGFLDTGE